MHTQINLIMLKVLFSEWLLVIIIIIIIAHPPHQVQVCHTWYVTLNCTIAHKPRANFNFTLPYDCMCFYLTGYCKRFFNQAHSSYKAISDGKKKDQGLGGRWYVKRGKFSSSLAVFWRSSIWGTHFFCKYLNIITVSCTWPTWRGKNKLKSDSWCWKRHSLSFWHASFHF